MTSEIEMNGEKHRDITPISKKDEFPPTREKTGDIFASQPSELERNTSMRKPPAPTHDKVDLYITLFVNTNALVQLVADIVLEVLEVVEETRINHLSLTILNAWLAFKTLSAIYKDKFKYVHEDLQSLWVLEIMLIYGDIWYCFDNLHTKHERLEFIYFRLFFLILSFFNWASATYIMYKYKLYHITYQGGDEVFKIKIKIKSKEHPDYKNLDEQQKIKYSSEKKIIINDTHLVIKPTKFNKGGSRTNDNSNYHMPINVVMQRPNEDEEVEHSISERQQLVGGGRSNNYSGTIYLSHQNLMGHNVSNPPPTSNHNSTGNLFANSQSAIVTQEEIENLRDVIDSVDPDPNNPNLNNNNNNNSNNNSNNNNVNPNNSNSNIRRPERRGSSNNIRNNSSHELNGIKEDEELNGN